MDYDIIIVEIRMSYLAFMLTACCEHSAGRGVMWSTHYLTKEAKLNDAIML